MSLNSHGQFSYYQSLKTYWNYRYHLVGDNINRSQHMPWDKGQTFYPYGATGATGATGALATSIVITVPDFLSPQGIGEPGMMVIGTDSGMSIPCNNIQTYNVGYPGNPDGTINGGPYPNGTAPILNMWNNANFNGSWTATGPSGATGATGGFPSPDDPGCTNYLNDPFVMANIYGKGGIVNFDDQTPDNWAYYVMMLATEWKLLNQNGQSTEKTEDELHDALMALVRWDNYTEREFPGETKPDGLFYRQDVGWDLALGPTAPTGYGIYYTGKNFGPNDLINSESSCTAPYAPQQSGCNGQGHDYGDFNNLESQDNIYPVMLALVCVKEFVENTPTTFNSIIRVAEQEGDKITSRTESPSWTIKDPNGKYVCRGYAAIAYSYLWAKAAKRLSEIGENYQNGSSILLGGIIWGTAFKVPADRDLNHINSGNFIMADEIAIAANAWGNHPGAGNIALSVYENQGFMTDIGQDLPLDLLNAVLNNKSPVVPQSYYQRVLSGYACYPQPGYTWSSVSIYTQIGYMLLFNLYALEYNPQQYYDLSSGNSVNYSNLQKRVVKGVAPLTLGTSTYGNSANPLSIEAADTLFLESLTLNSGAVISFSAPHINIWPGTYLSGALTITNKRMDCSDAYDFISPGGASHPFLIVRRPGDEDNDDEVYEEIMALPHDTLLNCLQQAHDLLNDPEVSFENKQLIYNSIAQMEAKYGDSIFRLSNIAGDFSVDGASMSMSAYPNPFSDFCSIAYDLPYDANISIFLFDLTGRKVNTLVENMSQSIGGIK